MTQAHCRTATPDELLLMLDWAAQEGWNPGLDDAGGFLAADPNGFFVAIVDGAPVACISVVNHSADFAFLGFYICHPEMRGRGVGMALWRHAIAHAGERTIGLDGVADQQANYQKSGFALAGSTTRFEGQVPRLPSHGCRSVRPDDIDQLLDLDRAATGVARPAFLRAWLVPSESRQSFVCEDADGIIGFVTARKCREGIKIGPAVCRDARRTAPLISHAAHQWAEAPVFIDLPERETDLRDQLIEWQFAPTFATARMYRGPAPLGDGTERSIATMELG